MKVNLLSMSVISVRADESLKKKLENFSEKEMRSQASVVRKALDEFLPSSEEDNP
jgi:predicted transcriptional regulator